jgi:hypothetical protein
MAIVGRTRVPPGSLGTALRHEIQQIDPDLPVYNLWTLAERLERNYWFQRIIGILFLIFGGVALLLASIGLYASMAHSVSQRTQEMASHGSGRDRAQNPPPGIRTGAAPTGDALGLSSTRIRV